VASGEDEERSTNLPIAEHSDPVDEVAMPSLSIPDAERMQQQLAESSGMGQVAERMQQQLAESSGMGQVAERMQQQLAESSGMGQVAERMQQQMAMPATVLADAVAHVKQQMAMPTAQLAEVVGRLQQMGAPSSQFLEAVAQMQIAVMPPGFGLDAPARDSMRRISEMMSARARSSANDVLARVGDLISSGDLDGEVLEHADQQLVADDDLNTAVDVAAAEVARNNPKLSRKMARRLVVAWVYLVWSAALMSLVLSPVPPVILAILGATGLGSPLMGTMAGKAFDKLSGPSDDDAPTSTDVQTD